MNFLDKAKLNILMTFLLDFLILGMWLLGFVIPKVIISLLFILTMRAFYYINFFIMEWAKRQIYQYKLEYFKLKQRKSQRQNGK